MMCGLQEDTIVYLEREIRQLMDTLESIVGPLRWTGEVKFTKDHAHDCEVQDYRGVVESLEAIAAYLETEKSC